MESEARSYYFDNIKAILIFLVVFAHFLKPVKDGSYNLQALYVIISIFQMPLFIFISGFFSKSAYKNGRLNINKIFMFIFLYIIFQLLIYVIRAIDIRDIYVPDIVEVSGAPWYLLAMAFWYLMLPILKEIKPKYGLTIALVFSLLIGYQKSVGTDFSASRIITWFPFFALGYYMDFDKLKKILDSRLKYLIIIVTTIAAVFIYRNYEDYEYMYDLLFSKKSYYSMGSYFIYGAYYRILVFGLAVLFSLSFMYLMQRKRRWFSYIGKQTLQIYMLHRILRDILECMGVFEKVDFTSIIGQVFFLIMTVIITYILSLKPFTYIFNKLCSINISGILVTK